GNNQGRGATNGEKLLRSIQEEIDRDHEGFDPRSFKPQNPLSIGKYHKTWLEQIEVTNKTMRDYKTAITKHVITHPKFGADKDIRKIRRADLVSLQKSLKETLTIKGCYNVMGALKSMIRWAYSNEEIKHVPSFPKMSMGEPPEIEYLTLEQQEQILTHISVEDVPIFRFAMEYGVRVGEIRALKPDAIKDGRVHIKRAFSENELRERTKTGDRRNPELTPYAKDILGSRKRLGDFVFVRADGKPYTNKNLNKIWHEAEKKSGIKIKLYNAIRHSLGCQLLDEGNDLFLVQEVLGHSRPDMTKRYAKRTAQKIGQILSMRRATCGRTAVEKTNVTNGNN
ncbi:MAG: site-specific integrase, partial [Syntrophobacterales bacterium]|nr:site-specific integrase [Syntrophobacterales bacterium]